MSNGHPINMFDFEVNFDLAKNSFVLLFYKKRNKEGNYSFTTRIYYDQKVLTSSGITRDYSLWYYYYWQP